MALPKIVQITATSVLNDQNEPMHTVFALRDDGSILYTGVADQSEWHLLPRPVTGPSGNVDE